MAQWDSKTALHVATHQALQAQQYLLQKLVLCSVKLVAQGFVNCPLLLCTCRHSEVPSLAINQALKGACAC